MQRFRVLDSWRGICALLVALFHFMFPSHVAQSPLIHNGWLLVDFFFVLSGFVIAHAYADKLTGWAATVPFMIRRFGRVYPLHFATLMFFVAFELCKI